jgi:hypothetical protein
MPDFLEPGIHRGVPMSVYRGDPCDRPSLNASTAKIIVARSLAHAWSAHPRGANHRRESTKAMEGGSLLDSLLLGGEGDLVELPATMKDAKGALVPTNDEYRLASAKEWRDQQIAAGRQPVKKDELRFAKQAAEAIRENFADQGVVLAGENQLTLVWDEPSSSGPVRCRLRLDHWRPDIATIYELKKAENAHPDKVARTMVELGYVIQAAAYVSGVEALMPDLAGRVRLLFLFAEVEPPYATLVAHPAGTMRALGEFHWRRAVEAWGAAIATGQFPGYAPGEVELAAPEWAMKAMEEGLSGGSLGVAF